MLTQPNKIIFIIFFLAFSIRFFYVSTYIGFNTCPIDDGLEYDVIARNLLERKEFSIFPGESTSYRPPMYPFFLASNYFLFGKKYSYIRLSQIIIGSITCVLIYFLAKKIAGTLVGLISMLISAFYPSFIYLTGRFLSETVFLFLIILLVYILFSDQGKRDVRKECFAGFLLGLTALTRTIALAFIPLLFLWSWIVFKDRKFFLTFIRIFLFAFLVILPWTIRNYSVHHSFVLVSTNGGITFFISNNPLSDGGPGTPGNEREKAQILGMLRSYPDITWDLPSKNMRFKGVSEIENNRLFYKVASDWIKKNPKQELKLLFKRLIRQYSPIAHSTVEITKKYAWIYTLSYGPIFLLGLLGILFSFKEPYKFLLFYLVLIVVTGQVLVFYGSNRMRITLDPFLIIWGAYGTDIFLKKRLKDSVT